MKKTALFLRPLDQLFFRDGKPFGASSRAVSGMPNPTTLTGALRTFLLNRHGADFGKLGKAVRENQDLEAAIREAGAPGWIAGIRVRGPWLASKGAGRLKLFLRRPSHYRTTGDGRPLRAALPLNAGALPGWTSPEGLRPLWCSQEQKSKDAGGALMDADALGEVLNGKELAPTALCDRSEYVVEQDKTGIQVDTERMIARDRMIYAVRMLSFARDAGFYCEVSAEQDLRFDGRESLPFGGESRQVIAEPVDRYRWPGPTKGSNRLAYLLSPGLFSRGWRPDLNPEGAQMVAAAVDGPFAISGWDMARGGPKATRFGVEAGSVYFYEGGGTFPASLCGRPGDAAQGYGDFLEGAW